MNNKKDTIVVASLIGLKEERRAEIKMGRRSGCLPRNNMDSEVGSGFIEQLHRLGLSGVFLQLITHYFMFGTCFEFGMMMSLNQGILHIIHEVKRV